MGRGGGSWRIVSATPSRAAWIASTSAQAAITRGFRLDAGAGGNAAVEVGDCILICCVCGCGSHSHAKPIGRMRRGTNRTTSFSKDNQGNKQGSHETNQQFHLSLLGASVAWLAERPGEAPRYLARE